MESTNESTSESTNKSTNKSTGESTNLFCKLWPPTQHTRLALVDRMTQKLMDPSIWSTRYGDLSIKEAEEHAKQIESVAFATASQHFEKEPDESSTIQLYSKECARLMLEVTKRCLTEKENGEIHTLDKIKKSDALDWPPSQHTRLAVMNGLTQKLKNPSTLSTRYSDLSIQEVEEHAKQIESMAFATASQHFEKEPDGDRRSTLELYSKEIVGLMLKVIKRGFTEKEDREVNILDKIKKSDDLMWPPSQTTRVMLVDRMTRNLTTPSILSRRYGVLSEKEAEENAKQIESVAFAIANQHFEEEPDGDRNSAAQLYAKESSRLVLEVIKRGPTAKEDGEINTLDKIKKSDDHVFDISGDPRVDFSANDALSC